MKRKNKLARLLAVAAPVDQHLGRLGILVPLAGTTIATANGAIVIEAMTDTLLHDMSEYELLSFRSCFGTLIRYLNVLQ